MAGVRGNMNEFYDKGFHIVGELLKFMNQSMEKKIKDVLRDHEWAERRVRTLNLKDYRKEGTDITVEVLDMVMEMNESLYAHKGTIEDLQERLTALEEKVEAIDRFISVLEEEEPENSEENNPPEKVVKSDESIAGQTESVAASKQILESLLEKCIPPKTPTDCTSTPDIGIPSSSVFTNVPLASNSSTTSLSDLAEVSASCANVASENKDNPGILLLNAILEGNEQTISKLLDDGADVNFSSGLLTPIWAAASLGKASILSMLLKRGAEVHTRTHVGTCALHMAANADRTGKCVILLIDAGADVNCTNVVGDTPLHCAACVHNELSIRALLQAGASKTAKNGSGFTPFAVADRFSVCHLLRP